MNGSQQALEQACAAVGLDAGGARLLRLGSNAVYHLKAPVIARISRPDTDIDHVRRAVAVARWLESVDYPAVRVIDVDQPVIADGYVVTFWQSVSDAGDQFATPPRSPRSWPACTASPLPTACTCRHWIRSPTQPSASA